MKKRIVTIIGTRPQFIKASALSRIFKSNSSFEEVLVHTGQHYDFNMSDVFFEELNIPSPQYSLGINGGSHGYMTGRMLEAVDRVLLQEKPAGVLLYGDTNSTLSGALSASKLHIPIIHVEAGLRSYNKSMPEEINRILTDHMSSLLFCPTRTAVSNLKKEGITEGVHLVGDVMYDATVYAINSIKNSDLLHKKFDFLPSNFALMTVHRQESTQSLDFFQDILTYVSSFSKDKEVKIVFPAHPRTRKLMESVSLDNLLLIDPLSYFETQFLLTKARYVLTDSGGLQKEAYFHKVPCITLRSETEWVETIKSGWNQLWKSSSFPEKKRSQIKDYGTGTSAKSILDIISNYLEGK